MVVEKYCIKWKNRIEQFQTALVEFIDQQILCDVTLVGDGELFKAHQFVLAACSMYFKNILKGVQVSQHPIIFLRDVSPQEIKCILEYMYKGETVVPRNLMSSFLKTCESLRVYGLYEEENSESQVFDNQVEESTCNNNDNKRRRSKSNDSDSILGPKQSRLSRSPNKDTNRRQDPPSFSPNLDLTQVDCPPDKATCPNPNDNNSILDSPPHSPQSLVFSVRNPDVQDKSATESLVILPENSSEIIVVSDDNTEKSHKTTIDDDTGKELDQSSDGFELALSPESHANGQDQDSDESEVIVKRKLILDPNPKASNDTANQSPNAKARAIHRAQGLKVVLTKAQIHSDAGNRRSPSPGAPRRRDETELEATDQGYQSTRVSPDRSLRHTTSRHVYVGGVFESLLQVPDNLRKFYCRRCRRCVRPVLWKRHVREHS